MMLSSSRFGFGRLVFFAQARQVSARQLVYAEYGDPVKVLQLKTVEVGQPKNKEVRVRWLAAPLNPADINQIQGVYPVKPPLPAVGGNEGFGEIEAVGTGVSELKVGDWVVPAHSGLGCWRTHANYDDEHLIKIDNDLPFEAAATFQVNPPTAYRMLSDFIDLKPGDLVVQNGANSAVGRAVIQIARSRGLRTINVVRKRDNLEELIAELKSLGADEVLTEEEMEKEGRKKIKNARLALNCVGGRSALMLASVLGNKGVMVTYGGMSKQPIQVPTGPLIFKDVTLVGFWMSRWYTYPEHKPQREEMFKDLANLIRSGKFRTPNFDKLKLDDWTTAVKGAMGATGRKQLFIL